MQDPLSRLALAGRNLLSRYSSNALSGKNSTKLKINPNVIRMINNMQSNFRPIVKSLTSGTSFKLRPGTGFKPFRMPEAVNPLQTIVEGMRSTLSRIVKGSQGEDYGALVKKFLPGGAELLIPEYPADSKAIRFADLDGDLRSELVASYRMNDEIETIILKKQNEQWYKAAEISHPGYDALNYADAADITGEGKKLLLIGLTSKQKEPSLTGYSLENGSASKKFTRNYHRFEILQPSRNRSYSKPQLAVWNRKDADSDTYDIEVLNWDGTQLKPLENPSRYYYRIVVPYYAQIIRQKPYDSSAWYNLADSLTKTGMYRDALIAIEVGMSRDQGSAFKDKFVTLKDRILG